MVFQFWSCLASGDSLWSLFIAVSLTSSLCWFSPQFPPPPVLDQLIALPSVHTPLFPSPDCLVTVQSSFQVDILWARFDSLCFSFPVFIPCGVFSPILNFSCMFFIVWLCSRVTFHQNHLPYWLGTHVWPLVTLKISFWFDILHCFVFLVCLFASLIELIHHQMVIIIFGVITSHSKFNYSQSKKTLIHWDKIIK